MHTIRETKRKILPIEWKQLLPRCSNPQCSTRHAWAGMLSRADGIWLGDLEWYCGPTCFETALELQLIHCFTEQPGPAPNRTTLPMGLMMLRRGLISEEQLHAALQMQRTCGEKIGACLQKLGYVASDDITSVVATQWGVPIFPAESVQPGSSLLIPLSLIERYRMTPVHFMAQGSRLFVAFCDAVNHSALITIEQMLDCDTEACILPESKLATILEMRKRDASNEVTVHRPTSAAETARMISNYAHQSRAQSIRLRTLEGIIWARLFSRRAHLDLVFE